MSLRVFHIFFIVLSVAVTAGFGLWCILSEKAEDVAGATVMGVVSLMAAVGLVAYGVAFLNKMKREGIK